MIQSNSDGDLYEQILTLTYQLLECILQGDWETYTQLCDPTLTCFEPEARGHLVAGMEFHKFYFDLETPRRPVQATISSPHIRALGDDAAVISYVRLVQFVDASGAAQTKYFEETRIWQRQAGTWKHVHFHRSASG